MPTIAAILLAFLTTAEDRVATRFAWPTAAEVQVRESANRRGNRAVLTYTLNVAPHAEGGRVLRLTDHEFQSMNGRDVTAPELRAALEPARIAAATTPPMRIDEEGFFTGITDEQEFVTRMLATVSGGDPRLEAQTRHFLANLETAAGRGMMEQTFLGRWNAWTGGWIGLDLAVGEVLEAVEPYTGGMTPMKDVTSKTRVECVELLVREGRPCVRLKWSGLVDGPVFTRSMSTVVSDAIRKSGAEGADQANVKVESASVVNEWEGIFARYSLCPQWIKTRQVKEFTVSAAGEGEPKSTQQVEEHEYEFTWPAG